MQINMPIPIRASVFGVPLEELMGCDGEKGDIPRVIKDSIQYLRESGTFKAYGSYLVLKHSLCRHQGGRTIQAVSKFCFAKAGTAGLR